MSKELSTIATQESHMSLFGRTRAALQEVGIDIKAIVDTYEYFTEQQKQDPELKIPTYRAKIPSGGGRAFDLLTGDEEYDTSVPTFRGVIATYHNCNALFREGEDGTMTTEPPLCQSDNGYDGIQAATGEMIDCAECPHNQWGTAKKGGKGKECKNMRRLYILVEGSDMPIVMTLPPTSIKEWEKYKSSVLGVQRKSPQDVVTEFSITVKQNTAGIKYSVVQFKAVGAIGTETRLAVKALGQGESYSKELGGDDYNMNAVDGGIDE